MKKFYKIKVFVFFILAIILFEHKIYAINTQIELIGENEVEAGEKQTINMKITSKDSIGVIEGIIKCDSNIDNLEVTSNYNGWTATYNESTGKFNIFNAQGCIEGEVLQITYVMKESAKNATISLSDLNLTTISYNTVALDNKVTKTIYKVENSNESIENEQETVDTYQTKPVDTYQTKTVDNTTVKTILPATGTPIIIFANIVILILGIITFVKNKKYKDLK